MIHLLKVICIHIIDFCFLQFGGFIDLEEYDTIALKLKGDGRSYISTVSFLLISNKRNLEKIHFGW